MRFGRLLTCNPLSTQRRFRFLVCSFFAVLVICIVSSNCSPQRDIETDSVNPGQESLGAKSTVKSLKMRVLFAPTFEDIAALMEGYNKGASEYNRAVLELLAAGPYPVRRWLLQHVGTTPDDDMVALIEAQFSTSVSKDTDRDLFLEECCSALGKFGSAGADIIVSLSRSKSLEKRRFASMGAVAHAVWNVTYDARIESMVDRSLSDDDPLIQERAKQAKWWMEK